MRKRTSVSLIPCVLTLLCGKALILTTEMKTWSVFGRGKDDIQKERQSRYRADAGKLESKKWESDCFRSVFSQKIITVVLAADICNAIVSAFHQKKYQKKYHIPKPAVLLNQPAKQARKRQLRLQDL